MRAIAEKACVVADKAPRCQVPVQEAHAVARRAQAAAIDKIDITINDEAQCMAELNAIDMNERATTKSRLVNGEQALVDARVRTQEGAVNALNTIRTRIASAHAMEESGSVGTQDTPATPCSLLTISTTTPMVAMAAVTPGSILPGNDFQCAALLLYEET